jgi:hypothetical protein
MAILIKKSDECCRTIPRIWKLQAVHVAHFILLDRKLSDPENGMDTSQRNGMIGIIVAARRAIMEPG